MNAGSASDGAAQAPAPAASPPAGSGGAWEAIIDKAITYVTEYLTTTTRPFDAAAALSRHMLHLLDRGTLRDVLVERNYNGLCGCLGCGNVPRGLRWGQENGGGGGGGDALTFDWPSSSSSESEAEEDREELMKGPENKEETERRRRRSGRTSGNGGNAAAVEEAEEDVEEIVYEDDLYTAESFRLAQRQRAVLNRMQHKQKMQEQKGQKNSSWAAAASQQPRLRSSGLLGATFAQRFCSAECVEVYETDILPAVASHMAYDFPTVFSAITNLFPNLSISALQQLAGAEVSAGWLVKPIQERTLGEASGGSAAGVTAALQPVQVGVSFESTERGPTAAGGRRSGRNKTVAFDVPAAETGGVEAATTPTQPPLLRDVLARMHVLQGVWEHEVVPRFTAAHLPRVAAPQTATSAPPNTTTETVAAAAPPPPPTAAAAVSSAPRPRPRLRGQLLLFDFLMTVRGARTRQLFRLHYAKHRAALLTSLARATAMRSSKPVPFFVSVSQRVVQAMEADYTAANMQAVACDAVAENDLRIDPALQQQRRELLTAHLFSEDVAATLSRFLLVDYVLLLNVAWSGVWMRELPLHVDGVKETCSLLRSLRFPSAMPAVLLRSAASSPEVVALAMVCLVAAGCCSAEVWSGCADEDAAFDEVAEVVGMTEEGVVAAVQSLMLGEEA